MCKGEWIQNNGYMSVNGIEQEHLIYPFATERYKKGEKKINVDKCLVDELKYLWKHGIHTIACCCGHGFVQGSIIVEFNCIEKMVDLGYDFFDKKQWINGFKTKTKKVQD